MVLKTGFRKCEKCKNVYPSINIFLCKGKMVCEMCYMQETDGNTIYNDETPTE